jgi:RNA polymerase sigma-70 factor (sigma-E family)
MAGAGFATDKRHGWICRCELSELSRLNSIIESRQLTLPDLQQLISTPRANSVLSALAPAEFSRVRARLEGGSRSALEVTAADLQTELAETLAVAASAVTSAIRGITVNTFAAIDHAESATCVEPHLEHQTVALGVNNGGNAESGQGGIPAKRDTDHAVTALYRMHYRALVRLAALLVGDVPSAEEVVQDAFIGMHAAWLRLRDTDKALSYLRQSVVNRSRSVVRHRMVMDKNAPKSSPDVPSAEQGAMSELERTAVISALRNLPPRQRKTLVLRFYADLSEAQIASAMGISRGAVKTHASRGISSLRAVLEAEL